MVIKRKRNALGLIFFFSFHAHLGTQYEIVSVALLGFRGGHPCSALSPIDQPLTASTRVSDSHWSRAKLPGAILQPPVWWSASATRGEWRSSIYFLNMMFLTTIYMVANSNNFEP